MSELRAVILRNIPDDIRQKLKIAAALENTSMQGLILRLITEYLGKNGLL